MSQVSRVYLLGFVQTNQKCDLTMDVFTSDEDEEAAALFVPNQVLRKPREVQFLN